MIVDYRSDTVTHPTSEMHEAMMAAAVGDDIFGEDPSINALQEKAAALFGMEAALFCPSGTMCNQIGIRLHTQPQDQVICDAFSHIYWYEAGGVAANSLVSLRLVQGDRGRISAAQVAANINPDDQHAPITRLVSLENTVNKGGGSYYHLAQIREIHTVCKAHGLKLHLDGARIFNALIETGESPQAYGQYFDSISVCLSKGLGAPVGSVLLMKRPLLNKAMRVRKAMGGAMRQAGYLAAAGIYALDHHIDRLKEDHRKARLLAEALRAQPLVTEVLPAETNIVIFRTDARHVSQQALMNHLQASGILAVPFGPEYVRLVTHLDITEEMFSYSLEVIKNLHKHIEL